MNTSCGGPLVQLTPQTIVLPDQLDAELNAIRDRGYSTAVNELEDDLACIAVPIGHEGQPARAALCLSGPPGRISALAGLSSWAGDAAKILAPLLY